MDKKKNRERERYLTAINWPHVAPPCLSVYLSISDVGRESGVCAGLLRAGPPSCVRGCVLVPAIQYRLVPSLLVVWMKELRNG